MAFKKEHFLIFLASLSFIRSFVNIESNSKYSKQVMSILIKGSSSLFLDMYTHIHTLFIYTR